MSAEFEDRISTQALTLQDTDIAEEEADYMETHGAPLSQGIVLSDGSDFLTCERGEIVGSNALAECLSFPKGSGFEPPAMSLPEIGLVDALGHDAMQNVLEACYNRMQAKRLVSLHFGHGGLAAGGRKRVDA